MDTRKVTNPVEGKRKAKVAVGGFHHETNTFAPFGTPFSEFEKPDAWPGLTSGRDIPLLFPPLNIPIGGFIAEAPDFDIVPLLWTVAEPAGPVARDAYERIATQLCDMAAQAMPLDGLFLDLHGAMVAEHLDDGEGELLRRLRAVVGSIPIVLCLDMHANITGAMNDLSDAIVVYRTYPHIDMAASGRRSAAVMRHLLGGGRTWHVLRKIDILLPMHAQGTDGGPVHDLFAALPQSEKDGVLSADIAMGFPLADIAECGPAVVVFGSDALAVEATADLMASQAAAVLRTVGVPPLYPMAEAVRRAITAARPEHPAMLIDAQDNPGCGGTSDEVALLAALVAGGAHAAAYGMIHDPEAAIAAHAAGIGARLTLSLGGRAAPGSIPYRAEFEVMALHPGDLIGTGVIFRDVQMDLGPMARLRVVDGNSQVDALLCSARFQLLDQALIRGLGLDPFKLQVLGLKSTIHWRADFATFAAQVIYVDAPGIAPCSTAAMPYRHLRPGVFKR